MSNESLLVLFVVLVVLCLFVAVDVMTLVQPLLDELHALTIIMGQ